MRSKAYTEAMERINDDIKVYEEYEDLTKKVESITKDYPDVSVNLPTSMASIPSIIVVVHSVTDFAECQPLLAELEHHDGWVIDTINDDHFVERRQWRLKNPKDKRKICVSAFLTYKSEARCEFVEVGTREEPVYEYRCKEETNERT